MNIALPQLICILAAAAFVRASHKIAAGFLLILFLFLISPFRVQIVQYGLQTESYRLQI